MSYISNRPVMYNETVVTCVDHRDCFAKRARNLKFVCTILNKGYASDGECPFCKKERDKKPTE